MAQDTDQWQTLANFFDSITCFQVLGYLDKYLHLKKDSASVSYLFDCSKTISFSSCCVGDELSARTGSGLGCITAGFPAYLCFLGIKPCLGSLCQIVPSYWPPHGKETEVLTSLCQCRTSALHKGRISVCVIINDLLLKIYA